MKHIKSLLAAGLLSMLGAVNAEEQTFIDDNAQISWLGRGVDSTTGQLKATCLNGIQNVVDNSSASFRFVNGRTASQSLNEMSGNVGAGVNLGLFAGSVSVSTHTRLEETSNSASVVYRLSYEGRDYSFDKPALNTTSNQLVNNNASGLSIGETCGDSFIEHLQLGNELYFVSQLTFANREDYQRFATQIRVRVLFWRRTETISQTFYDLAQNGVFSVKVVSPNTIPNRIQQILGPDGELNCGPINPQDNQWMNQCQTASNDVMDYLLAQGNDPNQSYNAWLANDNNLDVIYYTTSLYDKTGIIELEDVVTSGDTGLLDLHQQLVDTLTEQYRLQNILVAYSDAPRFDSTDYHQRLNYVNNNILRLQLAIDRCSEFMDVENCQLEVDSALGSLIAVEL